MKKRIIALLLAFIMLVGMLPVNAFAASQGQVRVIVENTTYTADEGAPWDGTLVDTKVDLTDNMTMMTAILTALDNAGHSWNYNSGDWDTTYISSIEKDGSVGLAEFDGGTGAGWKGTLNDWFVNLGFTDWKVSDGTLVAGDVIRVMYTQDMGADIGGEWGTNVGNLSSLTVSEGKLSPSFDKETLDYTLTVESDVSSVDITAVAENKEDKVTVTVGGTEYRRGVDVPVSDGTEISVACGAKTYLVTVSAAQPEPVTYAVTLPAETTGYTVAAAEGSVSPVVEGGSYSFTVTIADGYEAGEDFAVKANDVVLTAADGVYTIESITADQIVTVEGVAEKVAEEAVPFSTEIKLPSNGNSSWGYVSKLVLSGTDGSIYEAYWSATSNPFVLDVILGQDTDKDATITAAFSVAGLRAPSITGETAVTLQNGKGTINVTAKSAIASFYPDTNWTINLTVDDGSAANRASYTVTLPESCEAYTVTASSSSVSPVIEGRSYSFTVTIPNTYKAGENFAVKANDVVLEAINGVYTIENIQADQVVTVEGVEEKTLAELSVTVIAPAGSTISSGRHYSYFKYDFSEPLEETTLEDGRIQKVYPTQSGRQGFIRVQHPEGVTYWDFDGLTAGSVFEITEEMLFIGSSEFGKETVYANFEKNVKDKADLYLTANEKGWLDLNTGDTWNLNVFRNFLSLGNTISNDCLALPDVEYKVISPDGTPSDVVSVTPNENNNSYAEIKAEKAGTAIILVSYDAVYNCDGEGGKQWSAIWPENTGVVIVTVDAEDASIATNMTVNEEANSGGKQVIDAEHDILFYVEDSGASYSFKPEEGCAVTVNRSKVGSAMTFGGFTSGGVETAADGTVTVTGLTTGTHIIKVEKDGKAVYQVVRARQVSYEVKHSDGSLVTEESPAQPGETVTVQFHDLISPLEKLSGVYNANFGFYYNGQQGVQVRTSGGTYGVYTFSGSEGLQKFTVTVPAAWNETTYTLTDGGIKLGGFGGSFGSHRTTTYIAGKEVNTNASGTGGVASVLPDIAITTTPCGYNSYVATLSTGDGYTVNGVSGEANPIREGDTYTFTVTVLAGYDGENMVVKANGKPITATDGTYAVENVTENLNITVEGVEKIEADMSVSTAVYTNGVDGSGWGRSTYAFVDTVTIGGAKVESYTWDGDTCNVTLSGNTAKNAAVGFVIAYGGSKANWIARMVATLDGTAMTAGEPVGIKLSDGTATVELYASYNNSSYGGTKTFKLTIAESEGHTHTPGEAVTENETPATCTADGSYDTVIYCTDCKEEISRETTTVPANGHSYENGTCTVCGQADPDYKAPVSLEDIYTVTGDYLAGLTAPTFGTTNGEWRVIGLARAGRAVADSYYDAVIQYVKDNIDGSGRLHAVKSTDNSRLIVALTAIGKDVTNVGGYDLLSGLNDMTYIGKQGINGTIWALIAFDAHDYEIPAGDVTREKLVQTILDAQKAGGGWALSGTVGDPDMTGMALQALAPYYNTDSNVKTAVDKALTWLSGIQNEDGTFTGSEGTTSESISQVITGLTALGINPETDSRFIKNGVSAVDALSQFYVEGGGFKHILAGDRNMMATEQGYYALVSYYRLLQDKTALYDMSDVTIQTAAMDQEAADAVEALIDAIGTVTKDSGEEIKAARDAYDALTDTQKALVENYKVLTDAEKAYAELVKTAEDEAAAKAVEEKISAIGTVTLDSEGKIKEARKAYDALTDVQKALVSNLDKLETAEKALADLKDEAAADEVEKLIDAIGTVTKNSGDKIKAARDAYDKLTDDQKKLVENYKTLTDAEAKYKELNSTAEVSFTLLGCYQHDSNEVHTLSGGNLSTWIAKKTYKVEPGATVKDVLEMALKEAGMSYRNPTGNYVESINGIGEFTNGGNSGWMYTLNGTHPGLGVAEQTVKDGDVIVFHYTDDYTKEESSQGFADRDEAAAEKVEELIDAIGTVTLDSKDKIDAARKAYDALTYTQKQLVDNYATLTTAESKYAQLKKDADEAAAKKVEDMIDALDSNSATFEEDVKAAKKAYDALTADQKKLVGNYQKLADALKELASEADKKAAEAVEKLIDAIGTVTKDSEAAIKVAREAYDKLTDEQKALVGNLTTLEAAEEKLAALKTLVGIEDIYKATGDYLEKLGTPVPGTVGGEWMVIGLIRSGREVPDAYYDNAVKFVQENIDENGRLHSAKSTENSRMILALTAMGKDVTNVDGHNLLLGLTDMAYVQKQGINGPIWALIAFDSGNYPVPEGGDVSREALIQVILDAQLLDGGWALSGSTSDPDMTGMAIQALAPYYKTDAKVKAAVDETLETLSVMQTADGSFGSIDGVSAESIAQVVAGLSALGIDAHTDARFIKNGVSAIDALCAFYVEDGGFKHIPGGSLDGMATEQSYYALAAYFRMLEGKTALYDMTDVINMGGDVTVEEPVETLPTETEPVPTEPVETPAKEGRSFPWWLVIVIVVLAGAIVVLVIISKPKKGRHMK